METKSDLKKSLILKRMLRYHLAVLAYCISCATLHQLLTVHYVGHCNSWLTFSETGYCGIVRKTLGALRTSPLLLAGAVVAGAPAAVIQNYRVDTE